MGGAEKVPRMSADEAAQLRLHYELRLQVIPISSVLSMHNRAKKCPVSLASSTATADV